MTTHDSPLDADPLGLRRCAKCLYDRFGLADAQPCPECGYVVPAGVVVMTLPRATMTRPTLFFLAIGAVACFWFTSRVPLGQRWVIFLSMVPLVVSVVLRRLRIAWSDDAFVAQVWLSKDGVGLETDADRASPLRPIERLATRALGFAPMIIMVLAGSSGGRAAMIPFAFVAIVVAVMAGCVALNRRRARLPSVDDVAPPMYRWSRVRSFDVIVNARSGPHAKLMTLGFCAIPIYILFGGGPETAAAVRAEIDAARP